MSYQSKKTWKDLAEFCKHENRLTRRQMLARGMATGFMTVAAQEIALGDLIAQAHGDMPANCPAPVKAPGSIAQIFSEGGPTMGARFFSDVQAQMLASSTSMASNYGVTGVGTNIVRIGPNMNVDSTSPFGFTILQGPLGYPGGPAAWQANVLRKVSGGGHLGPFNQDDGAGQNTGLVGGVSPFKTSTMGKDIRIGVAVTMARWATALPAAGVSKNNLTPTTMASAFNLIPAASGLTDSASLTAASDAAVALQSAMSPVFGTAGRRGASLLNRSANCAFYGNSALADPNYALSLFDPKNAANAALATQATVTSLTNQEQALIAAFYQSALGTAGGVAIEFGGRDYHGNDPQNSIAPADIEEARAIVMWLAACAAANAPGAMIYTSNGQAIAGGTTAVTATINGATANLNAPTAKGDAGGSYNAGLIIFYSPTGSVTNSSFTGTLDQNGNAKTAASVGSSAEAVAGLYLSALKFINKGSIPTAATGAVKSAGLNGTALVI
jgi:hypothetical protein